MKKQKIILIHLSIFLLLSVLWLLSSEFVLKTTAPELNYVEIWIKLVVAGISILFIFMLISMIVFLLKRRK